MQTTALHQGLYTAGFEGKELFYLSHSSVEYQQHYPSIQSTPFGTSRHVSTTCHTAGQKPRLIPNQRSIHHFTEECRHYLKAVKWCPTSGLRRRRYMEYNSRGYLMLRNIRRVWLVFMVARAVSSVEMRCRRVLGSVWRTLLLLSPPLIRSRCIVSMGRTCWWTDRLANFHKDYGCNKKRQRKREGSVLVHVRNINQVMWVITDGLRVMMTSDLIF